LVTPSTPIIQSGTFGGIEPPVTTVTSDFKMPVLVSKWNQIIELQLSDGRKVCFLLIK
jgi:hypothetical protein